MCCTVYFRKSEYIEGSFAIECDHCGYNQHGFGSSVTGYSKTEKEAKEKWKKAYRRQSKWQLPTEDEINEFCKQLDSRMFDIPAEKGPEKPMRNTDFVAAMEK